MQNPCQINPNPAQAKPNPIEIKPNQNKSLEKVSKPKPKGQPTKPNQPSQAGARTTPGAECCRSLALATNHADPLGCPGGGPIRGPRRTPENAIPDTKGAAHSVYDKFNIVGCRQCPFTVIVFNLLPNMWLHKGNTMSKQASAQNVYVYIPMSGSRALKAHCFSAGRQDDNRSNNESKLTGNLLNCLKFSWAKWS